MAAEEPTQQKRALVLLADKNEDVEVVVPAYIFRYCGIETIIASVEGKEYVECIQRLNIRSDMSLEEAMKTGPFDVVFLAGGVKGAPNLAESELVGEVLKEQEKNNGIVGAICMSPAYSLTKYEIYTGRNITSYPLGDSKQLILDAKNHTFLEQGVVEDGPLITAQGPGYVYDVSRLIATRLVGPEKVKEVVEILLLDGK